MEYIILEPEVSDAKGMVDYCNAVGGETDFLSFGKDEFPFTIEQEEKYVAEYKNKKDIAVIVKNKDGEVIASMTADRGSNRNAHVYDMGISIRKEYWGKGIAKKLMQKLIDDVKNLGGEKIKLTVFSDNNRAIKLYKSYGFEKVGCQKREMKIADKYYDLDFMELML